MEDGTVRESLCAVRYRTLGSDAAVAVGRFDIDGTRGYCAKSGGPMRPTRVEAEADYLAFLAAESRDVSEGQA